MGQPAVALTADDGARATVLLHGGHLVSWIPAGGQEQIYVSPESRFGEGEAVRGGVPVIFPQFSTRGTLPRHGLLRTRGWKLVQMPSHGKHAQAVLRFVADDATRQLWPHEFEAEITFSLVGPQIDIEFLVVNTGDAPFEFTVALHTYLRTNDVLKAQLEGLQVRMRRRAGNSGRLFGSVGPADIAAAVRAAGGPDLDKRRIEVRNPIKTVGSHQVRVRLHPEVSATLDIDVVGA